MRTYLYEIKEYFMNDLRKLWFAIASFFALALVVALPTPAQAKGAVAARAAPVSVRSYSAPSTTRSYSSTTRTRSSYVPVSAPSSKRKRDDDVECSTLKYSRYSTDREVYRRYC